MEVKQIYSLMNDVTKEVLGKEDLLQEDLSNIVDVGTEIFNTTQVDNYVRTLMDKVGKVIFVNRPYAGSAPSVFMDAWDFGSVVQKINTELPEAKENKSWELEDGQEYSPDIFYKPTVSNKFFNNKMTFEIDMSFTDRQVKGSFNSATEINSFLSMLFGAVEKSFTIKLDALIMRTINNMIAETIEADDENIKAVNLLKLYNEKFVENTLTVKECLTNKEFMRFASMQMSLYTDRLKRMSTLFNVGKKDRFTPADKLHIIMLSEFKASADTYLQSELFHNEFTKLPTAETVPYWQGSGVKFDFDTTSKIKIKTSSGKDVEQSGVLAVMFDHDALGVSNLERRVTSHFNPKAEFYNNFFKMECGAFNDLNENFVVFFVSDEVTE